MGIHTGVQEEVTLTRMLEALIANSIARDCTYCVERIAILCHFVLCAVDSKSLS